MSRTGASTPEATKAAAAAASRLASLRCASDRFRGASASVAPSAMGPSRLKSGTLFRNVSIGTVFRLLDRRGGCMSATSVVRFGIGTAPQQVSYDDIVRVWLEADALPQISHAWLFDHLLPIAGDRNGPIFEGWTLLSALAAQTRRLRLGLLVTSNRFRPPAMLAKIATTVDIVSGGRLDFGIGAGSRPSLPVARREYDAHGLPYDDFAHSVASLAEACTVIRRLRTSDQPFDFDGSYVHLTGAFGNPKPIQRPYPPIMIGGPSAALLRVVAEHADLWNIPGGDIDDVISRSALLDRYCAEIGRDPAAITRSIHLSVSYQEPSSTRDAIGEAIGAGFRHIVLGLPAPFPANVAQWVTDEIITTSA